MEQLGRIQWMLPQYLNPSPPGSNTQLRVLVHRGGFVDWMNVGQAEGRLSPQPRDLGHLLSGAGQTQMGESPPTVALR